MVLLKLLSEATYMERTVDVTNVIVMKIIDTARDRAGYSVRAYVSRFTAGLQIKQRESWTARRLLRKEIPYKTATRIIADTKEFLELISRKYPKIYERVCGGCFSVYDVVYMSCKYRKGLVECGFSAFFARDDTDNKKIIIAKSIRNPSPRNVVLRAYAEGRDIPVDHIIEDVISRFTGGGPKINVKAEISKIFLRLMDLDGVERIVMSPSPMTGITDMLQKGYPLELSYSPSGLFATLPISVEEVIK